MEFPGGWGGGGVSVRPKHLMCEALLEFPEAWGVFQKTPSVGEVWIFSGTTHYPGNVLVLVIVIQYRCYNATFV